LFALRAVGPSRIPKSDDCATGNDQRATEDNWHCGQRLERYEIDDLPYDEQGRQIKADHLAELQWRKIENSSIAEQQGGAGEKQPQSTDANVIINRHANHGVATGLEYGCG
jgi:hypothetical protein